MNREPWWTRCLTALVGGRCPRQLGWVGLQGTGFALLQALLSAGTQPVVAAERIIVSYGLLERSIQVQDLELFAKTGILTAQLENYVRLLNLSDQQLQQIQKLLTAPVDDEIDVVAVGQFLYTPQGKLLLKQIAQVIQTPTGQAGFSAIRGALILATAEPEQGLTVLNFLRAFPTESIRVDVGQGLAIAANINQTLIQSSRAIDFIQATSAEAAAQTPADVLSEIAIAANQLRSERRYAVDVLDVYIPGLAEPVDLYLPRPRLLGDPYPLKRPLIVISHGLGSDRQTYRYLAEYLTEAGFAVAAIEHTGSNAQQLFSLLDGRTDFITPDEEFVQRPREVSLVLDALEQTARQDPQVIDRLSLERVGIIGQSFGGYTALALAGASLNLENLNQRCQTSTLTVNLSLLLQCQASPLVITDSSLEDSRIQAALVMNPIGSALFGEAGYSEIAVPLLVVAGAADTVAPAFPEQIEPFTWLTTPERYLLLIGRGTHFSVVGSGTGSNSQPIPVPPGVIGPNPEQAQDYMQVMSLIFFKVFLEGQTQYLSLLQPAFVENLGREPLPLSVVESLSPEQLQEVVTTPATP